MSPTKRYRWRTPTGHGPWVDDVQAAWKSAARARVARFDRDSNRIYLDALTFIEEGLAEPRS